MAAVAIAPQFYRHRPVLVAANLADLHGPVTGKLTLPLWVFWSFGGEPYAWNLDDPVGRREMYRTVVREAKRPADLDVLHGPTLVRIWRDMCRRTMPSTVQNAWEDRHPALAAVRQPKPS